MSTKKTLTQKDVEAAMDNCKKLPELAYVMIDGNPPGQRIGIVERGKMGYFPYHGADGGADTPESLIKHVVLEQNKKLGVTTAQMEAMKIGSMCGFHVPGADPDNEINVGAAKRFEQDASTWETDLKAKVAAG